MIDYIIENATTDQTTSSFAIRDNETEIIVAGVFDGAKVTFEDNKSGLGWASVLDANTGSAVEITEPTNELQIISANGTGRAIRAIISGAGASTDLTVAVSGNE